MTTPEGFAEEVHNLKPFEFDGAPAHEWEKEFYKTFPLTGDTWVLERHQEAVRAFIQTILDTHTAHLVERIEALDEFIAVKDNDGHRYQIPRSKKHEWDEFMEIPEDDERSWDVPEWAERIDGMPVTSFKDQAIDIVKGDIR